MRVGFILLDKKKPRVLTHALSEAAAQHGFQLVSLDPSAPKQWQNENVDVIVHKVPEDTDLDARLLQYQQQHPEVLLLDPPAAVRAVQDRQRMLAPLAGKQLLLTQSPLQQHAEAGQQPQSLHQHNGTHQQLQGMLQQQQRLQETCQQQQEQVVVVSTPAQVTLQVGCTAAAAVELLKAAGISYPSLVKPLITAPPDSGAVAVTAAAEASAIVGPASSSNSNSCTRDGHALGAVYSSEGVQQLVGGECDSALQLPVVIQQYVPHGNALYKLYVMGPHIVLTRRTTLTLDKLHAAAAATAVADTAANSQSHARPGVLLLSRVSAVPIKVAAPATTTVGDGCGVPAAADVSDQQAGHPAGTSQQHQEQLLQQQQQHLDEMVQQQHSREGTASRTAQQCHQQQAVDGSSARQPALILQAQEQQRLWSVPCNEQSDQVIVPDFGDEAFGVAMCDPSAAGDPAAPPLWAMQQLAAYLRQQLQLSLFNVDIIAPQRQDSDVQQQEKQCQVPNTHAVAVGGHQSTTSAAAAGVGRREARLYLVVDVNFFPGYDKVPGAEQLFADFLSSLCPGR